MEYSRNIQHSDKTELPSTQHAFEWAQQAMREKNWAVAAGRWAVLRAAYPNQPAPWIQAASAHIKLGNLEQAEKLLSHVREHFPNNPTALTLTAEIKVQACDWKAAEIILNEARRLFPDNEQTWLMSAMCAEHQGYLAQAMAYNEEAREQFSDRPGPFIQHAELAMRTEQWEQALTRWAALREHFPDIPAGYLRAAEAARQLGHKKEARRLILAHQYGSDLFEGNAHTQSKLEHHGGHTKISRLLELIWTKAKFNLRSEVQRNYLSYGWWILEPLLHMTVFYVVFGILLQRGNENYPVFLLTGLVPWMWFSKAISISSSSILGGHQLMIQFGVPPIVFPTVTLLQTTLKQLPVFAILLGFLLWQGFTPNENWWFLLPVILVQTLLIIAFSCAIAAVIPFLRDLNYLVPTGLMFIMFCSGIFYDYKSISAQWQDLFLLNPMAFLLKCYREIFIDNISPDIATLAWWGLGAAAICLVMLFIFARLRFVYPRIIMN